MQQQQKKRREKTEKTGCQYNEIYVSYFAYTEDEAMYDARWKVEHNGKIESTLNKLYSFSHHVCLLLFAAFSISLNNKR